MRKKLDFVQIASRDTHESDSTARFIRGALAVLGLVLVMVSCTDPSSHVNTGADLLSIVVNTSEPRPFAAFNERIAQAVAAGQSWPADPVTVVRRFSGWRGERQGVWSIRGSGERPSRYEITTIADGFLDDSVRGERLDVSLERTSDESWRITAARLSWRCWPGRGHTSFGTEPCR